MKSPAARLLVALLLSCTAFAATAQGLPPSDVPVWRVVLIRSWDSLYPINLVRERALREALLDKAPRLIEFYPEEIDPLRFPATIEDDLVSLLKSKYADTRMDLVIASGIEPFEFAARHRDHIWPGAALLFNGIFEGALRDRPPRSTGVTMALDIEGTLALGRAVAPLARRVYVVSGSAPYDQGLLALTREKLAAVRGPMETHYLTGLTRTEAVARVTSLEPDSLVLYLTMLRDADGQISGPGAPAMVVVSNSSVVPVVSPIQTYYGRGVLGGSSPHYDEHGRAAGLLARRILEGANPDAIQVATVPAATCEVDWHALQRWQIPEHAVPAGCAFLNRPPDPVKTYLWQVIAAVAIIVLQAALLSALLVQSRLRRAAEARLMARTAELAHESRISMIGALTANIAHEINQPMGAILSNTEAAQMMLDQGTLTPDKLREILADIRADDLRASEVIRELRKLFARSQWRLAPLEVNHEVAEALRHVEFEAARREVSLLPSYGDNMPAVLGDSVQLQQVVINLVVNGIEAVTEFAGARREVRIETRAVADGIQVAVADEGPGLTADDAGRLFESAFSTKRYNMGFGLSIVRTIVETHHGRVGFEPNVPRGAVFRVWLPAIGR